MRFLATFCTLITCSLLLGCHSEPASEGTAGASGNPVSADDGGPPETAMSLEPADLEKLASWDATSKASAKLTEMLAAIMSEVKDKELAEAAIPKLRELAHQFAAVNRAEKAFGEPSDVDQTLVLKNLAAANKKFDESYTPLSENTELMSIVGEAIDAAYVGEVSE